MFSTLFVVVVVFVVFALIGLLVGYFDRNAPKTKRHFVTSGGFSHHTEQRLSGKCRKANCRRQSRQRPYNGAWRQK